MKRYNRKFTPMYQVLKPVKGERFAIEHIVATEGDVHLLKMRSLVNGDMEYANFVPGVYTKLIDNEEHEIVMSDTPMERDTNREFMLRANGDVLIAGLGIGMLLYPLMKAKEVKSITVVEKYQEVYDLVKLAGFPFSKKVEVKVMDIFDFRARTRKWDCIWFDIWNGIGGDNYAGMKKLHRQFAWMVNRANPDCYIESWRRDKMRRDQLRYEKWEKMSDPMQKRMEAMKMLQDHVC